MAPHLSQGDIVLRTITVLSWLPAFVMLVVYGVITNSAIVSLCTIPITFSAIYGVVQLSCKGLRRNITILGDLFMISMIVAFIVPGIMYTVSFSWHYGNESVLATFGLSPLLINFSIHTYLVIRETGFFGLFTWLFAGRQCPHCNRDLRLLWDMSSNGTLTPSNSSNDSKGSYVAVEHGYTDDQASVSTARPSMEESRISLDDNETTRLV